MLTLTKAQKQELLTVVNPGGKEYEANMRKAAASALGVGSPEATRVAYVSGMRFMQKLIHDTLTCTPIKELPLPPEKAASTEEQTFLPGPDVSSGAKGLAARMTKVALMETAISMGVGVEADFDGMHKFDIAQKIVDKSEANQRALKSRSEA